MFKKIVGFFLVLTLMLSLVVGCTNETSTTKIQGEESSADATKTGEENVEDATDEVGDKEGDIKIGLTVYDLANPYFVAVANGAEAKAKELGVELIINDPKSDAAAQVTAIDNFIAMDVDAIIVCPLDVAACESVVQEAKDKGIAIITQSSMTETHDVWVSADEYNMGYTNGTGAADWIVEKYGADAEVKCAVLGWDQIPTQIARGDGMEDAIIEKVPNAKIIRQDANTTAQGQSVVDSMLQANPDLQVIVTINDATAIGAYSAVEGAGKDNEDFYIGGIDATEEALSIIKTDCAFRATVDLIPFENGGIDIELALQLINGEEVPEKYVIPAQLVTYDDIK